MSDFSLEHQAAVEAVRKYASQWIPKLSWTAGWDISVRAATDDECECRSDGKLTIEILPYVKQATIKVYPGAAEEPIGWFHGLEAMTVHELAHIVTYDLGTLYTNTDFQSDVVANNRLDAEDTLVWHITRSLLEASA
jgi:hypothetical protein